MAFPKEMTLKCILIFIAMVAIVISTHMGAIHILEAIVISTHMGRY